MRQRLPLLIYLFLNQLEPAGAILRSGTTCPKSQNKATSTQPNKQQNKIDKQDGPQFTLLHVNVTSPAFLRHLLVTFAR